MENSTKKVTKMKSHPYGSLTIAQVKTWVQNLLDTNDLAVCRALVVIFERQTLSEQQSNTTQIWNHVGFSGPHAEICSSFAKQYMSRGSLSPKQLEVARRIMKKYWRQLADIAKSNGKLPKSL